MNRLPLPSSRKSRRGLTLTEIAIVMTVIAFILAGIWAASSSVDENARFNLAIAQMQTVVQNTRDMYGANHKFATGKVVLNPMLVNAGLIPSDMLDGSDVLSPWDTQIFIRSTSPTTLEYEWQGLPEDICRILAGRLGGRGREQTLTQIKLDDGAVIYNGSDMDDLLPTNAPDCNELTLTYNLR